MTANWKSKNAFPQMTAKLGLSSAKAVRASTRRVVARAQFFVPSPQNPGPYATGALRASIHAQTDEEDGYNAAIAAAKAAPGTEIVKQGQILPHVPLPGVPRGVYAGVARVPLSYARLIHNGFTHPKSGKFIPGRPYLSLALDAEEKQFYAELGVGVKQLEK